MKNYILLILMLFAITISNAQAVNQSEVKETVTIDKSILTVDQLAKLESQQQLEKIKEYGSWVGVGKEIGIAVKEGLGAVVDVSDKFSKTDVGKFTMILIAWQIIGEDIVRIFLGFIFIILFNFYMFRAYKKNFTAYRVRKSGAWWKFWVEPEYEIIEPNLHYEGVEFNKILHIALYIAGYGICYALMFA